jgi:hypothetical protein
MVRERAYEWGIRKYMHRPIYSGSSCTEYIRANTHLSHLIATYDHYIICVAALLYVTTSLVQMGPRISFAFED